MQDREAAWLGMGAIGGMIVCFMGGLEKEKKIGLGGVEGGVFFIFLHFLLFIVIIFWCDIFFSSSFAAWLLVS